jgi:diguanylate cyclase (GGDEF)-like protein
MATRLDALTHCVAPQYFRTELADAVSIARRAKQPLSLVWLDVDECAVANQDHGFENVNQALARVGLTLRVLVGEKGTVGRLQGAAFAVLLPGATRASALELGQGLRSATAQLEHPGDDGASFELRLSGSVVQAMPNELPLNLLEAAEVLSVRAKQAGRDTLLLR